MNNRMGNGRMPAANIADLAITDFTPHLGTVFEVSWRGRTVPVTLALAEALPPSGLPPGTCRAAPFQLQFEEPEWTLPQHIHPISHPGIGALSIFMVPIGPNREQTGFRYQSVFT